jgi:hypothetical protein
MTTKSEKLTVREAATEAGVDAAQIMRWVDAGRFSAWDISSDGGGWKGWQACHRARRTIRIDAASFRAFMDSRMIRPALAPERPQRRPLPPGVRQLV